MIFTFICSDKTVKSKSFIFLADNFVAMIIMICDLLMTIKGVHSPGLPAAGMILVLGALVGIFIASRCTEVS